MFICQNSEGVHP